MENSVIDLEVETFKVRFKGEIYDLSYPSLAQIESLEKPEEEMRMADIKTLLESSGLPAKVIDQLQANHLEKLVGGLVGKLKS